MPEPPAFHAGTTGVESPTIFFNDTLPLTLALVLAVLEVGNSGNNALDNFGTAGVCFPAELAAGTGPELEPFDSRRDDTEEPIGLGTDDGARTPEAELDAHGVFLGVWRKGGTGAGPGIGTIGGCKGGNRSGGLGAGAAIGRAKDGDDVEAAWATRSHTCLEDCWEERVVVECLALRTRPLVIPA